MNSNNGTNDSDEPRVIPEELPQLLASYLWKWTGFFYLIAAGSMWWKGSAGLTAVLITVLCGVILTAVFYWHCESWLKAYYTRCIAHLAAITGRIDINSLVAKAKGDGKVLPTGGFTLISALHGRQLKRDNHTDRLQLFYFAECRNRILRAYPIDSTTGLWGLLLILGIAVGGAVLMQSVYFKSSLTMIYNLALIVISGTVVHMAIMALNAVAADVVLGELLETDS